MYVCMNVFMFDRCYAPYLPTGFTDFNKCGVDRIVSMLWVLYAIYRPKINKMAATRSQYD